MEKLSKKLQEKSIKLIKALQHTPEMLELTLDADGCVDVLTVIKKLDITYYELESIIKLDDKQRFELISDKIRASQCNILKINEENFVEFTKDHYNYTGIVYHGISIEILENILENGVFKMNSQFVHCSLDISAARIVCNIHSENTVILKIDLSRSYSKWLISKNNVILTKHISPNAIVDIIYKDTEFDYKVNDLFSNKSLTPDGTIIESKHGHDYVVHTDKNGEIYVVDGGTKYRRCSINDQEAIDISVYDGANHEVIRHHVKWGTRGIDGDKPLEFIKVAYMHLDHIYAVLQTQTNISNKLFKVLTDELNYRKLFKIK